MNNPLHSSKTDQWGTPDYIIDAVRQTFGGSIELDPASSLEANQIVEATTFFTEQDDALSSVFWCSHPKNIFINPPSGKYKGVSKPKLFWQKLVDHWEEGLVKQAIFLGFSLEQLAILQDCTHSPLYFSFCIPRRRIKFINLIDPQHKDRPTHSNYICYVDGLVDRRLNFRDCFAPLGEVVLK